MLSAERRAKCTRKDLVSAFMEMYDGDEVEVSPKANTAPHYQFSNPAVLPTMTSLHARTSRWMTSNRWDTILCTAESGEWLRNWKQQIRRRGARIAVVVADETHSGALTKELGPALVEPPRWLPWWLHNRHVTVFLKQRKVVGAIFFERRLRAGHIVPLWLQKDDARWAANAFVTYWIKANGEETKEPDPEIRPEQVRDAWAELLRRLYSRMARAHPISPGVVRRLDRRARHGVPARRQRPARRRASRLLRHQSPTCYRSPSSRRVPPLRAGRRRQPARRR